MNLSRKQVKVTSWLTIKTSSWSRFSGGEFQLLCTSKIIKTLNHRDSFYAWTMSLNKTGFFHISELMRSYISLSVLQLLTLPVDFNNIIKRGKLQQYVAL
jgi:hypothetical protein